MNVSFNNLVYWMLGGADISTEDIRVLKTVVDGNKPSRIYRFETAYMIALECLNYEKEADKLTITEKGLECLEVFKDGAKP